LPISWLGRFHWQPAVDNAVTLTLDDAALENLDVTNGDSLEGRLAWDAYGETNRPCLAMEQTADRERFPF
jgi:hypothetical protein